MNTWNHENLRIGDRERRQVLKTLSKHHSRGRVDDAELAELTDAVRTARTYGDLQVIFGDLGWGPQRPDRMPRMPQMPRHRRPFPLLPLLLVIAIVLAATGTIGWAAAAIGAGVVLLLVAWRRHHWGGPSWAC